MKRNTLIVLALLTLLAAAVIAQPGKGRMGMRGGNDCMMESRGHGKQGMRGEMTGRMLRMADEIGLSDEQVDKIKDANTAYRLDMVDKKAALKKAQIVLRDMMRDDADQGKVSSQIDNVAKLKSEIQKARYSHKQEVQSMLSEEQLDKLKELRKSNKKGKRGGRGHGHGDLGFFEEDGESNI